MREKNGVLIIPSNKNGDTLLNILSIIFDKETKEKYKFPKISKITFLETDSPEESENKIILMGKEYSQFDAYRKMINVLGLRGMEVRVKEMVDYVKDIPEILMSAINETGDQNLVVLDLTNGTKEITGTLYTAGTICGIKQMIYVQVKRNKDGKFYQLCEEEDKLNLFELTTFKALENIQLLASMNGMEFVMYKKKIEALRGNRQTRVWDRICKLLDDAVNYYFGVNDSDAVHAIQSIGVLNETIIGIVLKPFCAIKREPNNSNENPRLKLDDLRTYEKWYHEQTQRIRSGSATNEDRKKWERYGMLFQHIPNLYDLVNAERVYRNLVSHGRESNLGKEDAKLAIIMMMRIIDGLECSPLKEELFADEQ